MSIVSSEKRAVQGLGWIVLRSRNPESLARFYKTSFGLPELRSWPGGHMLWAGQYTVLEINVLSDDAPEQASDTPEACEMLPVFTVSSLSNLMSNHDYVRLDVDLGEVVCIRDTDGNWTGFVEAVEATQLSQTQLGLAPGMPDHIGALNHVLLRSDAPEAQSKFYATLFGSDGQLSSRTVDIGSSTHLHCLGGAVQVVRPSDRDQVQRVFIPRVYGFQSFVESASSLGLQLVSAMVFDGGHLNYYLDPVGQLFGFQERKRFNPDVQFTQSIEDKLAREKFEGARAQGKSPGEVEAV